METPNALGHLDRIREALARSPSGLITDVDGTIAPITGTPDETVVSPHCRASLSMLVPRLALVAVLTGRAASTARDMVDLDGVVYRGNHGLETWRNGRLEVREEARQHVGAIHAVADRLRLALEVPGLLPGLLVEDKGVSASFHYRLSTDPERARAAILEALASSHEGAGMVVTEGKLVVELRPPVRVDKGTSLRELVEEHGLRGVVCLGDDTTDVDAFVALHALIAEGTCDGFAIGVQGDSTPDAVLREADMLLRGVGEVEVLLERLAMAG
ncbi:MAG: trehalose-phosphatase [Chloroflexota bacterium]|nr:trehalose-phosphatase [Chloroflexota bacterium]MDE2941485.1 trehalose-phosphatase [Chloroflexota bacterium]MDE3266863.1 trehalose-phosphatase [Chloroflexota bacterium]